MTPGAIVEGIVSGMNGAGVNAVKVGKTLSSANEVSATGKGYGHAVGMSAATLGKNWNEEFAEQTNLQVHQASSVDAPDVPDKESYPISDSPAMSESLQAGTHEFNAGLTPSPSTSRSLAALEDKTANAGSAGKYKSAVALRGRKTQSNISIGVSARQSATVDLATAAPKHEISSKQSASKSHVSFVSHGSSSEGLWNSSIPTSEAGPARAEFPAVATLIRSNSVIGGIATSESQSNLRMDSLSRWNGNIVQADSASLGMQVNPVIDGRERTAVHGDAGIAMQSQVAVERVADSTSPRAASLSTGVVDGDQVRDSQGLATEGTAGDKTGAPGKDSASMIARVDNASASAFPDASPRDAAAIRGLAGGLASGQDSAFVAAGGRPILDTMSSIPIPSAEPVANGESSALRGPRNLGPQSSQSHQGSALPGTHPEASAVQFIAPFSNSIHSGSDQTALLQFSGSSNHGASQGPGEMNRDPFLAMDSESGVAVHESASGGVNQLTVGHQDPSLGYIELRAHSDSSGVHASLGSQSAETAEALAGHLSSLTSWLNEHHTPVESLTVLGINSQHDGRSLSHGQDSNSEGMTSGNGSGTRGGSSDSGNGGNANQRSGPSEFLGTPSAVVSGLAAILPIRGVAMEQPLPAALVGNSISVLA